MSNSERVGDYCQVYGGGRFYPADPRPEEVSIEAVAHALALTNRFGGHSNQPLSVAQHSVLVSELVQPRHALHGLLHDAHEAIVGDLPRPLKRSLNIVATASWTRMTLRIDEAVFRRFGVVPTLESRKDVHRADDIALAAEARSLMQPLDPEFARWVNGVVGAGFTVIPWSWQDAEKNFLFRFSQLYRGD